MGRKGGEEEGKWGSWAVRVRGGGEGKWGGGQEKIGPYIYANNTCVHCVRET